MNIKMLKDSSWQIKNKIISFKADEEKTSEEIGDDSIVADMLRLDYAVEIEKKAISNYKNKSLGNSPENKNISEKPKRGRPKKNIEENKDA